MRRLSGTFPLGARGNRVGKSFSLLAAWSARCVSNNFICALLRIKKPRMTIRGKTCRNMTPHTKSRLHRFLPAVSSLIQTLLPVLEFHQISHATFTNPYMYAQVADYTAGRESHPTPKNFFYYFYQNHCSTGNGQSQHLILLVKPHGKPDPLFRHIHGQHLDIHDIANADCL